MNEGIELGGATAELVGQSEEGATQSDHLVRPRKRSSPLRTMIEWVALVGIALVLAVIIKTFLFQAFSIPSASMDPTLKVGDRILVSKISYRIGEIERGDVVVFKSPPKEQEINPAIKDLVKRVVGLGGETIEGRGGEIYVNGDLLDQAWLPQSVISSDFGPTQIPVGSLFVMGDNRSVSQDSRYFGPIAEDSVVGEAFLRIWPGDRIGTP